MANNKEKRDKIFKEIETLLKDARIELEKKKTEDDRKDGNKTCCQVAKALLIDLKTRL